MSGGGRRRSLRTHLFAAIALVVVLSVGVTFALALVLTRRAVGEATLKGLSRQADLVAAQQRKAISLHLPSLNASLARQGEHVETASLKRPSVVLPDDRAVRLRARGRLDGTVRVGGTEYFFAARTVNGEGLVLLRPKRLGATTFRPFLEALGIAALAAALLAALVSLLLARLIARPVRRVAEATRSVTEDRPAERVPVEGAAELASLAESFNEMARRLELAQAAEQSFLLSVSHELKTPLTAIRGYAEGASDGALPAQEALGTIRLEARRLERLVHDLLDLGRMGRSEFSIVVAPIDLGDAAREVVRRYEPAAQEFGVRLEASADGPAPALGDADRVLQVASNLVENALRVTPPDGVVRVVAAPGLLAVEDTGPGLKPDELPHAFERFYLHSRYGPERPVGTGLGLAIVKELTEGMRGSVEVTSDPGRLTRFTVRLPADDRAATRSAPPVRAR